MNRSQFYLMWNIVSVAVLWVLFEATVPLLEVLPEENFVLILLITVSCFCFYKVIMHMNYPYICCKKSEFVLVLKL